MKQKRKELKLNANAAAITHEGLILKYYTVISTRGIANSMKQIASNDSRFNDVT